MAVADFLRDVGEGLGKAAKAAGSVAAPILERTAQVESGQAPQIDAEQRKRQEELEDAQINSKAQQLESQLAMGQKYGTLTTEQQQQYVDQIAGLYSHPRHAGTLMEKLRKAIHPEGTFAQGPQAPLKDATPPGGTAATDEQLRQSALADALGMRQAATDEEIDRRAKDAAKYHKPAGKSPPTPGNQIPADAIGPDGQVIPSNLRTAGQSFTEWNGAWYPSPKAKPIYKTIGGNVMLMDPQTGRPMRNLGPAGEMKVATHQTPFLGDDGQMHLLTTTSITTPQGETVEVEAPPPGSEGETKQPSGGTKASSSDTPKTPAKRVGSLLPKTGAKPASGVAGPAIPGSRNWAMTKDPLGRSDTAQYTKVAEDARAKKLAYENARGLLADNTRKTDLELVYAWVRANVQGAGRMTNTEINQVGTAGSWGTRIANAISQAQTGRLTPELETQFFNDIQRSYENAQKEADDLRSRIGGLGGALPPAASQPQVIVVSPEDMR